MGRAKGGQSATSLGARFEGLAPQRRQGATASGETGGSSHQQTVDRLGFGALLVRRGSTETKASTRDLKKSSFIADTKVWAEQENAFVSAAREELIEGAREFARSDSDWAAFVRMSALGSHSPLNEYWKRQQLLRKNTPEYLRNEPVQDPELLDRMLHGRTLALSDWKKLGYSVSDEYFQRRDSDWDERYAVEIYAPMGSTHAWIPETDAQGKRTPVIDPKTGRQAVVRHRDGTTEPKWRMRKVPRRVEHWKTSTVYHENAVRHRETGEPFVEPESPWANATGSEEDARKLLTDLDRVCAEEGLSVQRRAASNAESEHARYDRAAKTITVDESQPPAEQAVATLRALCEHVGYDEPTNDETQLKVRRAGAESAKHAVASLYGLHSQQQTFPFLADLADANKASAVAGDMNNRVKRILTHLDPVVRAKARAEGERKTKAKSAQGRGRKKAASCRTKSSTASVK